MVFLHVKQNINGIFQFSSSKVAQTKTQTSSSQKSTPGPIKSLRSEILKICVETHLEVISRHPISGKTGLKKLKNWVYLNTVLMSRVNPTRRRESNEIMREVNKNVHQIPMRQIKRLGIGPTLDPLIISIPTSHIMADKQPRPIGQRPRLKRNRSSVKWVVKGLKVGPWFELLQGFDRVRYGNGRFSWIKCCGIGSRGLKLWFWADFGHFGEEETKEVAEFLVNEFEKVLQRHQGLTVYIRTN